MTSCAINGKEWDYFIRELCKTFAHSALPERGDNVKAAKALKMSLSAVEQMKSYGKGSFKAWIKLAVYKSNLSQDEIKSFFDNFPNLIKEIKPMLEIDHLFEEIKRKHDGQEIAALLQLLLAKREVEDFVGVKVKVSREKRARQK